MGIGPVAAISRAKTAASPPGAPLSVLVTLVALPSGQDVAGWPVG
jgi:hypothetical protein